MDFKKIHIGSLIEQKIRENKTEFSRICSFMASTEEEIKTMLSSPSLNSDVLLKWCKLLEYDFFRIYSQHLILYSPAASSSADKSSEGAKTKTSLPVFRKHIYTQEMISFILEQISCGQITKASAVEKYRIPKTTLYKWINKYENLKS
ncbi:hypothetical protein [Chryseobacterium sp. Leaf394]|uniref:hypothetical protein n=1 Tax=Chryseobacterium sp. Leaf394 TaxID=1736361 RepID=UPI0006F87714|nr:hypothetical protein [Chryseobacterium sp. Leaf394]KQS90264.1 transposase [Chryseobacterium sp. Leaf394]